MYLFIYFKPFENKYNDTSSKNKDIVQCRCQKNHQRIDNAILILSSRPHLPTESCPAVSAAVAAVRSFTLQPQTRPEAPRCAVCRFSGILKPEPSTTTDFFFHNIGLFSEFPRLFTIWTSLYLHATLPASPIPVALSHL